MVSSLPKDVAEPAEQSLPNRRRWLGLGVMGTVWFTSSLVGGLVAAGHPKPAGWAALGLGAIAGGLITSWGKSGGESGGDHRSAPWPRAANGATEPSSPLWVPLTSFESEMQREWRRSARNRQSLAVVVCEAIAPDPQPDNNPATNPASIPELIPDAIPESNPPARTDGQSTPSVPKQVYELHGELDPEELATGSAPRSPLGQEMAQALERAAKRSADLLVWLDGDRLAAVLPNTDALGAIAVGEDLQRELASVLAAANPAQELQVAIAAATALPELGGIAEDFLQSALAALAIARQQRDDRVYLAGVDGLGDRLDLLARSPSSSSEPPAS